MRPVFGISHSIDFCHMTKQRLIWQNISLRKFIEADYHLAQRRATQKVTAAWVISLTIITRKLIEPIWTALGSDRAKGLPGLHAFSGTDNTGRFLGIGKKTWFKFFLYAGSDVTEAFFHFVERNV